MIKAFNKIQKEISIISNSIKSSIENRVKDGVYTLKHPKSPWTQKKLDREIRNLQITDSDSLDKQLQLRHDTNISKALLSITKQANEINTKRLIFDEESRQELRSIIAKAEEHDGFTTIESEVLKTDIDNWLGNSKAMLKKELSETNQNFQIKNGQLKKYEKQLKQSLSEILNIVNAKKLIYEVESIWKDKAENGEELDPKNLDHHKSVLNKSFEKLNGKYPLSEPRLKQLIEIANNDTSLSLFTHTAKLINNKYKILEENKSDLTFSTGLYSLGSISKNLGSAVQCFNTPLGLAISLSSPKVTDICNLSAGEIKEELVNKVKLKINERVAKAITKSSQEITDPADQKIIDNGKKAIESLLSLAISEVIPKSIGSVTNLLGPITKSFPLGSLGLLASIRASLVANNNSKELLAFEGEINQATKEETSTMFTALSKNENTKITEEKLLSALNKPDDLKQEKRLTQKGARKEQVIDSSNISYLTALISMGLDINNWVETISKFSSKDSGIFSTITNPLAVLIADSGSELLPENISNKENVKALGSLFGNASAVQRSTDSSQDTVYGLTGQIMRDIPALIKKIQDFEKLLNKYENKMN